MTDMREAFEKWWSGDSTIKTGAALKAFKAGAAWAREAAPTPPVVQSPAPAGEPTPAKARIPDGQTPLRNDFGHRYLDVIKEGERARDNGTGSPYDGHSLENCLHATGWVQRDLRLALDKAKERSSSAPAKPAPVQAGEPVAWAWTWEQRMHDSMGGWERKIERHKPGSYIKPTDIRGLHPLYLHPSDAYARGAEDMREKATRVAQGLVIGVPIGPGLVDGAAMARKQITAAIRALPLTEGEG